MDVAEVGVHVVHVAAGVAHEVMMGIEVRVEAGRSGAEVELVELTHGGQVVEGLVHGAQRDGRHLGADPGVHRLGGEVFVAVVEDLEDPKALGRDLQTLGPERLGEIRRRLHAAAP